jgi:hypothetical protein
MVEKPKRGERIRVLPRADASEIPTDSDATVPDHLALEPPTQLEIKKKEREPEDTTNVILPIVVAAVVVLGLLIYAVLR